VTKVCWFLRSSSRRFDDLWPLLDPRQGPPPYYFRNAIVHGEVFSESDWLALSYAGGHLRCLIKRDSQCPRLDLRMLKTK
jgi:hypothetical protein